MVFKRKEIKLTKEEKAIEESLMNGKLVPIKGKQLEMIEKSLRSRKKDVTMTIRINKEDIEKIRKKAKKLGVKYQTYISEVLHQVAQ